MKDAQQKEKCCYSTTTGFSVSKKWDMVEQGFSLMNLVMNDLQVQKTFLHLAQ